MIFALLLPLLVQSSAARLPPAGPVAPPGAEDQAVMQPINALLAGFAARSAPMVAAQLLAGGSATTVTELADGTRRVQRRPWSDVLARFQPGPERFEERLTNPAIDSDGNVAVVWGNYVFLVNGKVDHCGVDHFQLMRENGSWKIADVSWSERVSGCPPQ
jgi:hypothetical protein